MFDAMIETVVNNAPLVVVGAVGFWWTVRALYRVEKALVASVHSLDTRLTRVETKLHYPIEKRATIDPRARIPTNGA